MRVSINGGMEGHVTSTTCLVPVSTKSVPANSRVTSMTTTVNEESICSILDVTSCVKPVAFVRTPLTAFFKLPTPYDRVPTYNAEMAAHTIDKIPKIMKQHVGVSF